MVAEDEKYAIAESSKIGDKGNWYVVYTQPKREQVAVANLEQQGFEAYLPRYKTFKKSSAGALSAFEPMFPRYVFFRPGHVGQSISGARSTRGVSFVLSFGLHPALLKPEQLLAIQACEAERNRADLGEISPFLPGQQVRLRHCGLCGLEGLVKSVSAKRVTLLLQLLGGQKTLQVEHHQLELA
ncbi:transcription termination/antitermination NusG family protein [Polaromonas jejuensis]|uniref:Transcription termination/antitermination NusG family protein n=1 Tax=Polaromonas jejuensis TaxID=457502 RepID=A0ABW0Q5Y7_9BURK|nr:transcription termination/antitermination NusG family protein [Polaromonas jejuensis]